MRFGYFDGNEIARPHLATFGHIVDEYRPVDFGRLRLHATFEKQIALFRAAFK
jgi:hypothetical protein